MAANLRSKNRAISTTDGRRVEGEAVSNHGKYEVFDLSHPLKRGGFICTLATTPMHGMSSALVGRLLGFPSPHGCKDRGAGHGARYWDKLK